MQLILIRHSITAGNQEHRYIGSRTNEPLCTAGIILAQQKAAELASLFPSPELVLTSPMRRCIQTAEILFPGAALQDVNGLQECDFGDFEGKNYAELSGNPVYQAWIDSGGTMAFPGGESREAFVERCCTALERALQNRQETTIAAVVHGGTIMAVLSALEEQRRPYFSWQTGHCTPILCAVQQKKPLRLRQQGS